MCTSTCLPTCQQVFRVLVQAKSNKSHLALMSFQQTVGLHILRKAQESQIEQLRPSRATITGGRVW